MWGSKTQWVAALVISLVGACGKSETVKMDTSAPAGAAPSTAATASSDSMVLVRGTIASVSPTQLVVRTDSGPMTVRVTSPIRVYSRDTSDLAHVTPNAFIGVTTVKQPDGAEKATEIHVFPEELRGLGEGSRMMTPATGAPANGPASRMTNGNVSSTAAASSGGSRMSNGSVASTNGSTMVVQYPGGTTTVSVPSNVSVTEIKRVTKQLAANDQVIVIAKRDSAGLVSQTVMLSK